MSKQNADLVSHIFSAVKKTREFVSDLLQLVGNEFTSKNTDVSFTK